MLKYGEVNHTTKYIFKKEKKSQKQINEWFMNPKQ